MPFVSGYLRIRGGGHADNELPEGEGETDPGYGIEAGGPGIDNELPKPPPGVWPPPVPSHPIVPAPPTTPPGTIWPPVSPAHPDQGLPSGGGQPDNTLPGENKKFWVVVWIPGYGWKYMCVDPSLHPAHPINQPPTNKPVETPEPKGDQKPTKPI